MMAETILKPKPDELTHAEKQVLGFLGERGYPRPGSFFCALIDAMFRADTTNMWKLETAYPELVGAVRAWQHGDLHERSKK